MLHQQFTRDTRVELAILLNADKSHTECARVLGFDRTTISKEISRNKDPDGTYRSGHAHQRYLKRRQEGKKPYRLIENNRQLRRHITRKLKKGWSPEQIAGRLQRIRKKTIVCHETIYTWVYEQRPDLIKYLRRQKSQYRKKRGTRARIKLNQASKIRRISERPVVVEERVRVGDWEDDTMVGKERTKRIWTCVERKSGFALAEKLDTVSAESLHRKSTEQLKKIPKSKLLTLTRDNGGEFGDYDHDLENKTGLRVYRANPYHSWERGTNENWNGLLRQFFPKGTLFANITNNQVQQAVRLLNNRPRKRLGYATPREVFKECGDSE